MNWLKDIFNCNAMPRTIASLPQQVEGRHINQICGQSVTAYSFLDYNCQIYAKRTKDMDYDIMVKYWYGSSDEGKAMIRCSVPLAEAMEIIRSYDDKETYRRVRHMPKSDHPAFEKRFVDPARQRNNVRRVQQRLTVSNPRGH
ncbi:MAG: hypothetical protein HND56_06295 [Pseudomonadota bacterium]|nr:hypothetical protein [Pseudomonadota bacterium]QKK05316.1 MAG: hypothetical protein HND56_06295 [Pseudomonadota bacterium]|tara:strand:+ start:81 stop:509 length:429 start_codon:yes stop_codon:yes gene_type:complete